MHVLNFEYNSINHKNRVLNFEYDFNNFNELWFKYQFEKNLINTRTFNKPVAAIKVAAGFVSMRQMFARKVGHNVRKENNFIIKKEGHKLPHLKYEEQNSGFASLKSSKKLPYVKYEDQNVGLFIKKDGNPIPYTEKDEFLNKYIVVYKHKDEFIRKYVYANVFKDEWLKNVKYATVFKSNFIARIININYYNKVFGSSKDIYYTNIYENILANYKIKITNPIDIILASYKTKIVNPNKILLPEDYKVKTTNIIKYIPINKESNYSIFKNYFASYRTKILNIIDFSPIYKNIYELSANKYLPLYQKTKVANAYKYLLGVTDERILNAQKVILAKRKDYYTNIFKDYYGYRTINIANILSKFDGLFYKDKYIELNKVIFGKTKDKNVEFYKNIFAVSGIKNTAFFKQLFLKSGKNIANILTKCCFGYKNNIQICTNITFFGVKNDIFTHFLEAEWAKSHQKITVFPKNRVFSSVFIQNITKNAFLTGNTFINKDAIQTFTDDYVFTQLSDKYCFLYYHKALKTDLKPLGIIENKRKSAKKHAINTMISYDNIYSFKNIYTGSAEIHRIGESIHRSSYKLHINEYYKFLYKDSYKIIENYYLFMFRDSKYLSVFNTPIKLNIKHKDINADDYFINLNISSRPIDIFSYTVSLLKEKIKTDVLYDTQWLIKNVRDINLFIEYSEILIPSKKTNRKIFAEYIDEFLMKVNRKIFLKQQDFMSKIKSKLLLDNTDLFFEKEPNSIYLQIRNYWLAKNKLAITINNNILGAYKDKKLLLLDDKYSWGNKNKKSVDLVKHVFALKSKYNLSIFNDLYFAFKDKKDTNIFPEYWALKSKKEIFYFNDIFGYNPNKIINIIENPMASKEVNGLKVLDLTFAHRTINQTNILEADALSTKELYNIDIFRYISEIHRIAKESRIADHIGEWCWGYEPPNPFDTSVYGIDELLLPEVDTRYEDFEDLIFDKEKLKPRKPIKVIDDNTWIAILPIRHPLPERKNKGNVYTGIVDENYFGIITGIMRQVYLEFYTLWQAHLFQFSTMTMIQALKKMLEYLYSYIMISYSDDELEEALRVYHQIRWFGESAVLNNSQYIVSIERDTLRSNLHTGGCAIPNNLKDQDTMYIDSTPGVCAIRNNEAYINADKAYVEFYLDIHASTTFRFDLINTVGSVNIYIDNVKVDTISKSQIGAIYELTYTGETVTVRIEKTRENNKNKYFYICNIQVANESFKELSIDFDPKLRAGNKPMDEIAKKMITYANLYDDIEEAYNHIRKTNLGVSVTFDQILTYWNEHHQNKIKGKRLTINKT